MTRALILTLLLALIGAAGWALWLRAESARVAAAASARDLAAARAEISALAEARDVARAHYLRIEKQAAERDALLRKLLSQEGANAPLSDYLRDAAGQLWP